jgi:hypothetical protein
MNYARRVWLMCLCCAFVSALPASAQKGPVIITFDPPESGTGAFQGTSPYSINPSGEIAGYYLDSNNVGHGFVRSAAGKITTFDAPAAGTGTFQGTGAFSINPNGTSVGFYQDANCVEHAFQRTQDGAISSFDAPGAGTTPGSCLSFDPLDTQGTAAMSINAPGEVAGSFMDANDIFHGFVRTKDGVTTTFDAPGAGTNIFQGTFPAVSSGLNNVGTLIGDYMDENSVYHGFVRTKNGEIISFDVNGAGTGPFQGTDPISINSRGQIVGIYLDSANTAHGFVRNPDGSTTTIDVPGAGTGSLQGTFLEMNTDEGFIVGDYADGNGAFHGFLRNPKGEITYFDVPGAGTGNYQGTIPTSINAAGTITGIFADSNTAYHGFVLVCP